MAIQTCGPHDRTEEVPELSKIGFTRLDNNLYTIPRTNEDGTPYISNLF